MQHCAVLGHVLMAFLAAGLGLPSSRFFADALIKEHLALFRAFHYPPRSMLSPDLASQERSLWGVGEHTDYGLMTLLKQDSVGGLEVRSLDGSGWLAVPPRPATLVVNIGDTLESITGGLLRSTPHRVRNPSADAMRVSLPYFFDPGFDAVIERAPLDAERRRRAEQLRAQRAAQGYTRWDNEAEPTVERRTYGDYLVSRVAKVFPQLAATKL
jgi:isopenicillin N synthase-like dioxygenase